MVSIDLGTLHTSTGKFIFLTLTALSGLRLPVLYG